MDEVRLAIIAFYLLLVLQATAAATKQLVRADDEAYLSCENVIADQEKCSSTTWIFSRPNRLSEELVTLGNVREKKPNLRLSQNCSLVIRKVTAADAGLYHCQQFKSETKLAPDAQVSLAVVTLMEQKNVDEAKLSCSVVTYESCPYKVKLLFNSNELVTGPYVKPWVSACQATVKCLTSSHIYESRGKFLKCEVKDDHTEWLFPFIRPHTQNSVTTAATTETTILTGTAEGASTELKDWWWLFVTLSVVLVAILLIVVKVFKYKRSKGSKTNKSVGQILIPPMIQSPPETSQDMVRSHTTLSTEKKNLALTERHLRNAVADPEDCVSYSTVSIKANGKAKIGRKNDDSEDSKVIYTSVIFTA